jgi:ubiquinone/menaquinone biosynthesis C-methylase UbiE
MSPIPPVPDNSAPPADPAVANDYDSFAEAYSAANEASLINAYYERPALLDLAGNVAGHRILDAGCGSGPLFAALRERGAVVTGLDKSAALLELARQRLGADADLRAADLGEPLPFPDDTGLGARAHRAAPRAQARRAADHLRRPSLRH